MQEKERLDEDAMIATVRYKGKNKMDLRRLDKVIYEGHCSS